MRKNMPVWWSFTPWVMVRTRLLTDENFDPVTFARKHDLDAVQMKQLHEGRKFAFWPELCAALSKETGMSEDFFAGLSRHHHIMPPSHPMAAKLPLGNLGQSLFK